jgi:hypothetical protein
MRVETLFNSQLKTAPRKKTRRKKVLQRGKKKELEERDATMLSMLQAG